MYLLFENGTTNTAFAEDKPGPIVEGCTVEAAAGRLFFCDDHTGSEEIPTAENHFVIGGMFYRTLLFIEDDKFDKYFHAHNEREMWPASKLLEQLKARREFICHGTYCISNACGYEVEISSDGDAARLRINYPEPNHIVTDWLYIDHSAHKGFNDDGSEYDIAVIDPPGYCIYLNEVMRC